MHAFSYKRHSQWLEGIQVALMLADNFFFSLLPPPFFFLFLSANLNKALKLSSVLLKQLC